MFVSLIFLAISIIFLQCLFHQMSHKKMNEKMKEKDKHIGKLSYRDLGFILAGCWSTSFLFFEIWFYIKYNSKPVTILLPLRWIMQISWFSSSWVRCKILRLVGFLLSWSEFKEWIYGVHEEGSDLVVHYSLNTKEVASLRGKTNKWTLVESPGA